LSKDCSVRYSVLNLDGFDGDCWFTFCERRV
jgi:hypothetical protein